MPTINLKTIMCILSDEIDKDEVYLKMKGKKIWPKGKIYKALDSGEKNPLDIEFEHEEGEIVIELWDYDFLSRNDLLGTFTMKVDDQKGNYTASLKINSDKCTATYMSNWATV